MVKDRRVNDAQVERLLAAMRRDPKYRAELAAKLVEREGIEKFTKTGKVRKEWARRYKSTMRRLQRYVTEAGEKRSFARAPIEYQREVRQQARALPPPRVTRESEAPPPRIPTRLEDYYDEDIEDEDEFELTPPVSRAERERELANYPQPYTNLYRAIVAYHDGDVNEARDALGLDKREADLLSLATFGEGTNIESLLGAGVLSNAVAEWLATATFSDVEDIQDFHDLLMNLPDWQIGMILGDMEDSSTTFADWLDAWRNDGMDLDAEDSEYWELWRAAYARAMA